MTQITRFDSSCKPYLVELGPVIGQVVLVVRAEAAVLTLLRPVRRNWAHRRIVRIRPVFLHGLVQSSLL